jgi:lipopolysaccharide/colanic/teichoic acid biosynthesis glycosyltransferase
MKRIKRLLDIFIASTLLILSLPIMIIVAIAIKLDSPGPILYYYRDYKRRLPVYRIGKNGKPFRYFKFRTMYHYPDSMKKEIVTPVGYFLRRWHLDELPEFIIVLNGKMSLVGPRPMSKKDFRKYPNALYEVLKVTPGITGIAQTTGYRKFSPEEKIAVNLRYINDWSLAKDLMIILKTPLAIVAHRKMIHYEVL